MFVFHRQGPWCPLSNICCLYIDIGTLSIKNDSCCVALWLKHTIYGKHGNMCFRFSTSAFFSSWLEKFTHLQQGTWALGDLVLEHTLSCKNSFTLFVPFSFADFKWAVGTSLTWTPDCRDQSVWFVWSNGSHLNSLKHALMSCTAWSSFFILLNEPCFLQSAWWWIVAITWLMLFTFWVFEMSCFSLLRI